MIRQILILLFLVTIIGNASATYEQVNETLYIYNATQVHYMMAEGTGTNCENVLCTGGICTEFGMSIASTDNYEMDYELNYAPNETMYYTVIMTVKQEELSSSLYGLYKKVKRTLLIDAVEVATYNNTVIINTGTKNNVAFKAMDQTITFGSETINTRDSNKAMFFSELVMNDQYNQLYNESGYVSFFFKTSGEYGTEYRKLELGGFTGIFLSIIKKIPFVGTALYNVLYPIITVIQHVLDFSFTFLNLIINDWWYALLLLECVCMFIASRKEGYVEVVSAYFTTHVIIIQFVYHKIILPMINLCILILNTIKNMIQWWSIILFYILFPTIINNITGI